MSDTPTPQVTAVDFSDPALPARLHHAFDEMREVDPVYRLGDGRWLLTRYDDVAAILKDQARFGTDIHAIRGYAQARPFGAGSDLEKVMEGLLINLPADAHRQVRGAFTKPFTRAGVEAEMTELVETLVDELLSTLPPEGEVEWVEAVARRLPGRVFQTLFDLPRDELEHLLELLHHDTVAIDVLLSPEIVTPAELADAREAFLQLRTEIDALARIRHGKGGGDLLSYLLDQHDAGRLSWDDVLTQAMESLAAGTSTTMTLLAGMVEAFARHPDQWDLLRADPDPGLVAAAVEEALRWVSPALAMGRVANAGMTLHGREIAAGDVVQCGVLAANRDPRVFDDPHAFDITRSARPRPDGKPGAPGQSGAAHVAFGGGRHTCLGAHVARLEARVVLQRLRERYASISMRPDAAVLHPTVLIRTYQRLPVRFEAP